jgi:uncharacterized protein (UPF0276 family)
MWSEAPFLGVGIGWRKEISKQILRHKEQIDWCEVISEHFINVLPEKLDHIEKISTVLPVVPHGIDLSIGTDIPIEQEYLDGLANLVETVNAPWFTDHLCFTRAPGYNIGQLTPLRFSDEVVELVVRKSREVTSRIRRPFLLENITYYFKIPGGEMTEPEFITQILEQADIGMLLDVCNLYFNAVNHGYDPYQFLREIPLDRVVQLHLAGGFNNGKKWIDSHSFPVHEEVFQLTDYIVAHAPVKGILVERDDNYPESFQDLVDELCRARDIFKKHNRNQAFASAKA